MSNLSSEIVDDFVRDVQLRPDDFILSQYRVECTKTNNEYWISNGLLDYHMDGAFRVNFTLRDKFRFHSALAQLKRYHYRKSRRTGLEE